MSSASQEQIAGMGREGRRRVNTPVLEAARQETVEDHLGAALIEHGDSVIVKGEVLSQVMGQDKQGGTACITSHALPLAVYGIFLSYRKDLVTLKRESVFL